MEECFVDYSGGYPVWNTTTDTPSTSETVKDLRAYTVYSFQACMDQCAQWNQGRGLRQKTCGAVTYTANLTQALSALVIRGDCWLKDARGIQYDGDQTINYDLVASAYIVPK